MSTGYRVAGIDFSTRCVDVVTIPFDPYPKEAQAAVWTQIRLTGRGTLEPWFTACRNAGPRLAQGCDWERVAIAFVERPIGLHDRRLLPLFGAIVASIPPLVGTVTFLTATEWRRELFRAACMTKEQAKAAAEGKAVQLGYPRDWPEDAYEALGLALAGRALNQQGIQRAEELAGRRAANG